MGWNWNDALGGAIDGFFSYGPYGALAGGAMGGWAEDWDKSLTGDSNSGFVESLYGARTGGAGSRLMDSFDTNNGGKGGNQGTGANEPAWGTSDGFTWGSLLGNGMQAGQQFGSAKLMGGLMGGFGGGGSAASSGDLPANAGISFGEGAGNTGSSNWSEVLGNTGSSSTSSGGGMLSGISGLGGLLAGGSKNTANTTVPTSTGYGNLGSILGNSSGSIMKVPGLDMLGGQQEQQQPAPGGDLQAMKMANPTQMASPAILGQVIAAQLMNSANQNRLAYMRPGRM